MPLPPQHRIDAPSVYVSLFDEAWDWDRIEQARGEAGDGLCAYDKWLIGRSRYDFTQLPEDAFKPGMEPAKFHLRRLTLGEWSAIKSLETSGGELPAKIQAFRLGVKQIEGVEIPGVNWPGENAKKRLGDDDMRAIEAKIWREIIEDVGKAVIRCNTDLRPEEKKS